MDSNGSTAAPPAAERQTGMLELRKGLTSVIGNAFFRNVRTVLTVHGKEYGAIVGPLDLERLRALDAQRASSPAAEVA